MWSILLKMFPLYIATAFLIQLVPVRINLYFLRENKNDFVTVRVNTLFSLIRFNVEIPVLEQKTPLDVTLEAELKAGQDELVHQKKKEYSVFDINWEKFEQLLEYIRHNRQMLWFITRFYARAVTVEKLKLLVRSGVDDAAVTGLLSGLFWTVSGALSSIAQQWLKMKERPAFSFSPDFRPHPALAVKFDAVVAFRIGHFTIGALLLLVTKIRGG